MLHNFENNKKKGGQSYAQLQNEQSARMGDIGKVAADGNNDSKGGQGNGLAAGQRRGVDGRIIVTRNRGSKLDQVQAADARKKEQGLLAGDL